MIASRLLISVLVLFPLVIVSGKRSDDESFDIEIDPELYENAANKNDIKLIIKFLNTISSEIYPLTAEQVSKGDRVFGGAVFLNESESNYPLITVGTNRAFTKSALFHGEISTITNYHNLWNDNNLDLIDFEFNKEYDGNEPDIEDTIFLATHEPCSYCLSAISWNGFKNFYYLFTYDETEIDFEMPGDILMHEQVFNNFGTPDDPYYNTENIFWKSHYIVDMIYDIDINQIQQLLINKYNQIKANYIKLMQDHPGCNKELIFHGHRHKH